MRRWTKTARALVRLRFAIRKTVLASANSSPVAASLAMSFVDLAPGARVQLAVRFMDDAPH